MKRLLIPLFALLSAQIPAYPALAQTLNSEAMSLARQAVSYNTPRDALLTGASPLAGHPMFQQVFNRLDFNKINEQAAQLMVQTFTEDEIRALVAFMSSPAGQRIGLKMPGYQKLVGAMVQNEMKTAFEGYILSQGTQGARPASANGPALQGLTPLPTPRPATRQ